MIAQLFLLWCTTLSHVHGQYARAALFDEKLRDATRLFSGLEAVKDYFRNSTNPTAKDILSAFETECFYMEEPKLPVEKVRRPFVVLEGNHQNSREVVGVRLATMLDGRYLVHPAPCLLKFLDIIPKGTLLRRAYYALSLYVTSFNVKVHLSLGRAVVLNGYWLDQLSFALIQSLTGLDLPSAASDVFRGPPELLQPDLIVYLNLPDDLFLHQATTRSPTSWKRRALALYEGLRSRHPIVVQDLKGIYRVTTDNVYQHIVERLGNTRDIASRRGQTNFDYSNH